MSKNLNAPEHLQPSSAACDSNTQPAPPRADRRRCARWNAHVPVFVYGHPSGQSPFHEDAYSAIVSERGALLIMTTPVPVGEKLLLINKVTQADQECRVAHVGPREGPSVPVGVEFTDAAPQFWRVTAPPRRAEAISPTHQHKKAH